MTMDVYFDYACPYCVKGLAYLQELIKEHSKHINLNFIPVEAHPRPEVHGLHTDLCAQGYYAAMDQGMDPWDYHAAIFKAAVNDRVNIEDADALGTALRASAAAEKLDADAYADTLKKAVYANRVDENNRQAYDENGVWAVPTFIMEDGRRLDAREGIGVRFKELEALMKETRA